MFAVRSDVKNRACLGNLQFYIVVEQLSRTFAGRKKIAKLAKNRKTIQKSVAKVKRINASDLYRVFITEHLTAFTATFAHKNLIPNYILMAKPNEKLSLSHALE